MTELPPRLQGQLDRFLATPAPDASTTAGGQEALSFKRLLEHPGYFQEDHPEHAVIKRRVQATFEAEFGAVDSARRPNPIVLDTTTGKITNLLSKGN